MPEPLLTAHDLHQSFRIGERHIEVLRGVSLEVPVGDVAFLVGASGAGKTTLLYTLAGLERPESGEVRFEGASLYTQNGREQARVRNERMGFIFQGYHLLPELTALENVKLPAMMRGGRESAAEMEARAAELLNAVQLGDRLHHLPAELSGGEQQRVAMARSLMNDPAILFADEPTGNLDSKTGAVMIDLLLALVRERRKTLLVVTHDHALAERGDRKLEIRDGVLAGQAF